MTRVDPRLLAPAVLLGLVVVACATEAVEPYDYEDDDDANMYVPDGSPMGSSDGGSDDGGSGDSAYGLEGDWSGNCIVDLSGFGYEFTLDLGIEDDDGSTLSGRGALGLYGYDYTGDLVGEKSGDSVNISFEASSSGYPINVDLSGEADGDRMSGACTVLYYSGTFEVERG